MSGPYVVTTKRECDACWDGRPKWAGTMPAPPCSACNGAGDLLSRVAVATLDEAHAEVIRLSDEQGYRPFTAAAVVAESGGTVGPLPDGTVVEVEQISELELCRRAGFTAHGTDRIQQVCSTFNAQEAKR